MDYVERLTKAVEVVDALPPKQQRLFKPILKVCAEIIRDICKDCAELQKENTALAEQLAFVQEHFAQQVVDSAQIALQEALASLKEQGYLVPKDAALPEATPENS
jgi:hypothetical protein